MTVRDTESGRLGKVAYFDGQFIINWCDGAVYTLWSYEPSDLEIIEEPEIRNPVKGLTQTRYRIKES